MNKAIVGHMDADEFEAMIETFIEHRSGEDDRLPAQTFFELLAERQLATEPVEVRIAWLETGPVVLLLDEPTRGVDVAVKHEIYELMNRWTGEGRAVVLITSEMPELLAMADRILVMCRGRVTAEYTREQATQEKILEAAMGETA